MQFASDLGGLPERTCVAKLVCQEVVTLIVHELELDARRVGHSRESPWSAAGAL